MPPPPLDEGLKPMGYLAAALWAVGAQLLFLWVVSFTSAIRGGVNYDLVGLVGCQVVAYLFTLVLILRVYAPNASIRLLLAARKTNPWFILLALVLGVASSPPANWLYLQIEALFPPAEQLTSSVDVWFKMSHAERLTYAFCAVVLGPIVEEVIFRGALFRLLRLDKPAVHVIPVTAFLFALIHLVPNSLLPLALMGLLLGYLRWASGSLIPPILLHVSYNGFSIIDDFRHATKAEMLAHKPPISFVAAGAAVMAIALMFTHVLARNSRRATSARTDDK